MHPDFEHADCPICERNSAAPLLSGPDLLHPSPQQFQLVSCQHCGHIYQNPRPRPEVIGRYYPPDYAPFQTAIADEPRWWRRVERRIGRAKLCRAVHSYAGGPGHLLDIGCATGLFLDGMRRLGWGVAGVEPSPGAAAYARERFGLQVFQGTVETANLAPASFDAVTLWDVLEHVPEPRMLFAEVQRILRPGGVLVISLPNPDSLEARLLKQHWLGWDLPRHLNLFKPALLKPQLARYGLQVEAMRSFIYGYATLVMSLEQKLKGQRFAPLARMLLRSLPLRLATLPYYNGPANWYNLSSTVVIFARKKPYA
ncbi:MAG: class I SAM-dependent methyltransferase [Roseiflexaceae bacterium]|nr:class I SAM-dependent methyltransferase [Roseiflexaceae bacterium]